MSVFSRIANLARGQVKVFRRRFAERGTPEPEDEATPPLERASPPADPEADPETPEADPREMRSDPPKKRL